MRLLRLITLRSLRARPFRSLLSGFAIALGVASILAIGITNRSALEAVTRVFEGTSGRADLIITSQEGGEQGIPEAALSRVRTIRGAAAAVPLLEIKTILPDEAPESQIGLSFFGSTMGGLTLFGIDPLEDPLAREYTLVEGRFLEEGTGGYQVVLVGTFAEEQELEVGDKLNVLTPDGVERFDIVGLMAKEGPGQVNNGAFGVVPLLAAQEVFGRLGELDQIDVLAEESASAESIDGLRAELQARLGEDYAVTFPAAQGRRMAQMLGNYQIGLNFLSGIALFIGALLIYNAFAMTVVERTREFGMLRTVGLTRTQVITQVLAEAAMLGLLGSLAGVLLGLAMSFGLSRLMEVMLNQEMRQLTLPVPTLITSVVVGVFVTLLAALLPATQAGRISPLEALRIQGRSQEGRLLRNAWKIGAALLAVAGVVLIANPFPFDVQFRLGSLTVFALFAGATLMIPASVQYWQQATRPLTRKLYGTSGSLGSGNLSRAKLRTTLTVAALMVGVAMILIVRTMTESFSGDLRTWIDSYVGGDLFVAASLPMHPRVGSHLESVPGVEVAAPVRYLETEWRRPDGAGEAVTFMAIDPALHSRVTSFVFSETEKDPQAAIERLAAGNAVFLSSVLAEKNGLAVGDPIELKTRGGWRTFVVAAVVVDFYNQGQVVQGSWADLRRSFGADDASAYLIRLTPGFEASQVRQAIEETYGERDRLTVESNAELKARIFRLMDQAFSLFDVLAVIALLVASLGIFNTLTMNVLERTREIGMLRAIGMGGRQVLLMILSEAGLMGLIGGGLGLALGLVLSRIFFISMNAMSGYDLAFVLPLGGLVFGLIVALAVSHLAALLPARRATSIRILDAIHYE